MPHFGKNLIAFLAALILPSAGHQLLAPGESVGNIRLGDTRDSVSSAMGEATKESNTALVYVLPATREVLLYVLPDTQTVQVILFTSPEYRTTDSLSVNNHLTTNFLANCLAYRSSDDSSAYFIADNRRGLAFMKCSDDIVPGKKVIGVIFGKNQNVDPAALNDKLRWQNVPSELLQGIALRDQPDSNGANGTMHDAPKNESADNKIKVGGAEETDRGNVGLSSTPFTDQSKTYSFAGITMNEYSTSAVSKLGETGAFPSQIGYHPTTSEVLVDYLSDSTYLDTNMLNINNLSPIETVGAYSGPLRNVQLILDDQYDKKSSDYHVIGVDVEVLDATVSGREIPRPGEYYDALIQKYGKPERTRVSYDRDFIAEWPVRGETKLYYVARGLSQGSMDRVYWLFKRKEQPDPDTGLVPVHVIYSSVSGLNRIVEDYVKGKENKERDKGVNQKKNKSLF